MLPFLTIFSLALSLINALAIPHQGDAAELAKRGPAPLSLDFQVVRDKSLNSTYNYPERHFRHFESKSLSKRSTPVTITNDRDVSYLLDVYLGSQKDKVSVILDTGSSDLWVYGPEASGAVGGSFDPSQSSHDQNANEQFSITYLDGSGSSGEYYKDDFSFSLGNKLLLNFQFAVVDKASSGGNGILGVADKNQESVKQGEPSYDNLPYSLQKSGVTPKASYSLFLGSEDSGKGSIIFGGIDKAKYEGELQKYPVTGDQGLAVNVESASINGKNIDINQAYLLDSGTSWNLWTQELLQAVGETLGGTYQNQVYIVDCNQPSDKYLTFNFGKNSIKVSYKDLVIEAGRDNSGNTVCAIGAQPSSPPYTPNIFGDVFLRSAYVYYDLTDDTISLAQAKYTDESNIVAA